MAATSSKVRARTTPHVTTHLGQVRPIQPEPNRPTGERKLSWFNLVIFISCVMAFTLGVYQVVRHGSHIWILLPAILMGWWTLAHIKE